MTFHEEPIVCGKCGRRIGWATVSSIGTSHQFYSYVCLPCLQQGLATAHERGVPEADIKRAQDFLDSSDQAN